MYRDQAALRAVIEEIARERAALAEERAEVQALHAPPRRLAATMAVVALVSLLTMALTVCACARAQRAARAAAANDAFSRSELAKAEARFAKQTLEMHDSYESRIHSLEDRLSEAENEAAMASTAHQRLVRARELRRKLPSRDVDIVFDPSDPCTGMGTGACWYGSRDVMTHLCSSLEFIHGEVLGINTQ